VRTEARRVFFRFPNDCRKEKRREQETGQSNRPEGLRRGRVSVGGFSARGNPREERACVAPKTAGTTIVGAARPVATRALCRRIRLLSASRRVGGRTTNIIVATRRRVEEVVIYNRFETFFRGEILSAATSDR